MARSRVNWIKYGDQNTNFFQRSVVIRRRRNKISSLEPDVGQTIDSQDLVPHIVKYFSDLFTSELLGPIYLHNSYINGLSIHHSPSLAEVNKAVF